MRKPSQKMRLNAVAAAVIAAIGYGPTQAATVNWTGASSTWNTATNWSSNPLLPGAADDVVINVAGVQTVTHFTGTDTVNSISTTGDEILAITGGILNAGTLNNIGTGAVNVSGGTFGITSGSSGTMNLTGGITALGGTLNLTGVVTMSGGTIQGGTVQENAANALKFATNNANTLDGVTVRGTLNVGDAVNTGGRVRISNGLTVQTEAGGSPGVVNVGTIAGATNALIGFTGTQTFNNATINLGNATQNATISLDAGGTLTLGSGAVIQGRGTFGTAQFVGGTNNLINGGLISANISGGTLTINNNGAVTNNGTVEARNGGTLTIAPTGSTWSNASLIRVADATSTVNMGGTFTNTGTFDNVASVI